MNRYTLITNLECVTINNVRTYTHALLLEEFEHFPGAGPSYQMRGFGVDPGIVIFDMTLPSPEYRIDGTELRISSGPRSPLGIDIDLSPADLAHPFEIDTFTDIKDAFARLPQRVAEFWPHPFMPAITWTNANRVRSSVLGAPVNDGR